MLRTLIAAILLAFLMAAGATVAFGQKRTVTVILVRHAEKDLTDEKDPDPELNVVGKFRAEMLVKALAPYGPLQVFSTDVKRSRNTAAPFASRKNLPVQIYDARKLKDFSAQLLATKKNRRILVVGHSNTTTPLVNLLIGEQRFKNMGDFEYDKIYIVKVKNGKSKVRVVRY